MEVGCFGTMQKRKMQIMPDFKGQRGLFATECEHFASKTAVFCIMAFKPDP